VQGHRNYPKPLNEHDAASETRVTGLVKQTDITSQDKKKRKNVSTHVVKAFGSVHIKLHSFLNWALSEGDLSTGSGSFTFYLYHH
jgi:hypothetical protein